jgi:hypothetical protein
VNGVLWLLGGVVAALLLLGRHQEPAEDAAPPRGSEELDAEELEAASGLEEPEELEPEAVEDARAEEIEAPAGSQELEQLEELEPEQLERAPAPEVAP